MTDGNNQELKKFGLRDIRDSRLIEITFSKLFRKQTLQNENHTHYSLSNFRIKIFFKGKKWSAKNISEDKTQKLIQAANGFKGKKLRPLYFCKKVNQLFSVNNEEQN